MVDEATLKVIVERVLVALAARQSTATPRRQVLVLFSGAGSGYLAGMEAIHELTAASHRFTVVLSPAAAELIGVDKVRAAGATEIVEPGQWICAPAVVKKSDLLLVPTMSMNLAARLAAGLMDSLLTTLIIGGLLAGKPVIGLREGADPFGPGGQVFGDGHGAPALRARLAQNLKTVVEYGMTLVTEAQFLSAMRACLHSPRQAEPVKRRPMPNSQSGHAAGPTRFLAYPAQAAQTGGNGSQFITAADLLPMQPGATVRLSPNCRLTPLAQDTVRRMNLKLEYE